MISGAFKRFKHDHIFKKGISNTVLMIDVFNYTSPYGILGKLADILFLKRYMTHFLATRNLLLKDKSESLFVKDFC